MTKRNRKFKNHYRRRKKPSFLAWRIAGREEGVRRLLRHKEYYEGFNQGDLNFRVQKTGATLKEWKVYAPEQVCDFTKDEKRLVDWSMNIILRICAINHYDLPRTDKIIFIKTTMREECSAAAYTHGTEIYLGQELLYTGLSDDEGDQEHFLCMIAHEMFHVFTRSNPYFRKAMYSILGFKVHDREIPLSEEVASRIIRNPDAPRRDSSASFTIGGRVIPCLAVFTTTRPFENPGDSFIDLIKPGLVPIEDPSVIYDIEEASDFWEIFGRNTEYVVDPEEVLADNFGYALVIGPQAYPYESPEIIERILDLITAGDRG